jgi:hypothetical protein
MSLDNMSSNEMSINETVILLKVKSLFIIFTTEKQMLTKRTSFYIQHWCDHVASDDA